MVNIYIELNQLDKASELAQKTSEIYPAYYEIFFRLAALQHSQNNQTKALENLRKTLALLPVYTPASELFANILSHQNQVSKEDKILTNNLVRIGIMHGIPILDHIIIGNNNYYSFFESGEI